MTCLHMMSANGTGSQGRQSRARPVIGSRPKERTAWLTWCFFAVQNDFKVRKSRSVIFESQRCLSVLLTFNPISAKALRV